MRIDGNFPPSHFPTAGSKWFPLQNLQIADHRHHTYPLPKKAANMLLGLSHIATEVEDEGKEV